ncbi:hypothetical protein ACQ4PT_040855 [Festuca glaucescens]
MEEGGDQDLFHTTPPAAPPSMVESSTTPMHIATPDCMVMNPQSAMKETPIKKFYISGRATRILEARKLEELKKRMQFEEKSTKLTNQPKPTATASIPSPEHNICLHGSKLLENSDKFKSRYKVFYSRKTQAEPLYVVPIAVDNKRKRDNIDEQTALLEKEQAARIAAVNSKGRQLSVGQLIMKAEGKLFHRDERGKFKSNLSVRASSTGAVLDLNDGMDVIPTAAQQGDQPMVELSDPEDSIVRGQKTGIYKDPIAKCLIFYNSLKGTRTFNLACMNWFEHNQPTTIKISGETICDESSKGRQYGKDYSDAVTRMLTCGDDKNHIGSRKREKHYMAYSWACQAIRAKGMGGVRQYKEFFVSDFYKYDVDKCNKIAATVETHGYHSCYIWDIIKKEVHVLDPVKMTCRCATIQKLHEPIVVDLSKCLILCLFEFFPECKLDGLDWKIIYRNDTSKRCKWQNSGLYALLYAQFYHGSPLGDRIDTTDLGHFRARHLWEVMLMDGNVGAMPLALTMYQNLGDDKAAI